MAAARPRASALARAAATAASTASTPTTSNPWAENASAFSPVPQPASSTGPRTCPSAASRSNAGCARPMSQGGVPLYASTNQLALMLLTS